MKPMIKSRRFRVLSKLPRLNLQGLSFYWQGGVWRDILSHASQLKMLSIALEVAFLFGMGLLFGSFALLQSHHHYIDLPSVSLTLSYGVTHLIFPTPPQPGATLGQSGLIAIAIVAWLCFVASCRRLSHLVSQVYRSSIPKRARWLTLLFQWLITAGLLITTSLALYWVGPESLVPTPADLKLKAAEGSLVAPNWQTTLWHILRWPAALGVVGVGLAILYRLSPQRWQRGAPLWPGVGLCLALGSLGTTLATWGLNYINAQALAYGQLFELAFVFTWILGLILLVPIGAQFNVSLVNQNRVNLSAFNSPPLNAPPPSFETFKIHRGRSDRFPPE